MKIAVIGASGLVGATVVEHLIKREACEVIPFIHSSGNAWRLARLGIKLEQLDVLDPIAVQEALRGCTHIVNCSRGDNTVLLRGLKHLLGAAGKIGIRQFVHLSSVAVYGDPPHPDSSKEDAPANPAKGTYGWAKLQQDKMVQAAAKRGLPATILCPPNISGPFSYYLLNVLGALRRNAVALFDNGENVCVLSDVANLAHAIELAIMRGPGDGRRMFITDDEHVTWRMVIDELTPLLPNFDVNRLPSMGRSPDATGVPAQPAPNPSLLRSLRHLVSSDVRAALRKDPLWAKFDKALRSSVSLFGSDFEERMRLRIEGPIPIAKPEPVHQIDAVLSTHQLRKVWHDCGRAKDILGYKPRYTFSQSMEAFRHWYRVNSGIETEYSDLLAALA